MSFDLSDIETKDIFAVPTKGTDTREKHKCDKCAGTGTFHWGYMNPRSGKCHACNGRGYFFTSRDQRQKNRLRAAERKAKQQGERLETFAAQEPAAWEWLSNARGDFPASLRESIRKYGSLTEGQLRAVYNCIARDQDRAKQRNTPSAKLDLGVVFDKFNSAKSKGLKRLKLRLEGVQFSLAPDSGRNAGHLYVKNGDEYLGKVAPTGEFFKSRDCGDDKLEQLKSLSGDLLAAAKAYGQKTGQCSCCGRELTNAESIRLGIGPICAENWGL
jgi:hypothetical protein